MIKVTYEEPHERKVIIETTEYGAQFIAYCLRYYSEASPRGAATGVAAEAAKAISTSQFVYDRTKILNLFK